MEVKANSGNTAIEITESPKTAVKKPVKTKSKTQHVKVSHPPTSEMVNVAIKELKDRKGSSVKAIKKYIATAYKVDSEKFAPFIKRYLKAAVASGAVVQTKGKGASGSFKISVGKSYEKFKVKKVLKASEESEQKKVQSVEKKSVAKKTIASKKTVSLKKSAAVQKSEAMKKTTVLKNVSKSRSDTKSISKTKKTAKAPAAKTKIPKPKKTAAPKTVKSAKK